MQEQGLFSSFSPLLQRPVNAWAKTVCGTGEIRLFFQGFMKQHLFALVALILLNAADAVTPAPSVDTAGRCGPDYLNTICGAVPENGCCSQFYYCGNDSLHCGSGCVEAYSVQGACSSTPSPTVVDTAGRCGPDYLNTVCGSVPEYGCCSQFSFCGSDADHCGTGCVEAYSVQGACYSSSQTPTPAPQATVSPTSLPTLAPTTLPTNAPTSVPTSVPSSGGLTPAPSTVSTSSLPTPAPVFYGERCGLQGNGSICTGVGPCCSNFDYCGDTADHCDADVCQVAYSTSGACYNSTTNIPTPVPTSVSTPLPSDDPSIGNTTGDQPACGPVVGASCKPGFCCASNNLCGNTADYCNQATCQPQYTPGQLCDTGGTSFWESAGQAILISIVSTVGAALIITVSAKGLKRRRQLQRGDPIGSQRESDPFNVSVI